METGGDLARVSPKTNKKYYYTVHRIKYAINHLNQSIATGADGVPALLLKRFSSVLAPIVHDIITAIIEQCKA